MELERRIYSYCQSCAEKLLSEPQGGPYQRACYKVKKTSCGWTIIPPKPEEEWKVIPDSEIWAVEIGKKLDLTDFEIGKEIQYDYNNNTLTIDGKDILKR